MRRTFILNDYFGNPCADTNSTDESDESQRTSWIPRNLASPMQSRLASQRLIYTCPKINRRIIAPPINLLLTLSSDQPAFKHDRHRLNNYCWSPNFTMLITLFWTGALFLYVRSQHDIKWNKYISVIYLSRSAMPVRQLKSFFFARWMAWNIVPQEYPFMRLMNPPDPTETRTRVYFLTPILSSTLLTFKTTLLV